MNNVVSKSLIFTLLKPVDVTQILSLLARTVNAFKMLKTVMGKLNVVINLMKEMRSAASKDLTNILLKSVDVIQRMSGPIRMVIVSQFQNTVMERLNAPMNLMKVTITAVSKASKTTVNRPAAVIQTLNGHAKMETVSPNPNTVTVKHNVPMVLMKSKKLAAGVDTNSTTTPTVAVIQRPIGPATTVTASKRVNTVMEKLNVPMAQMRRKTPAASNNILTMDMKFVAVTQKLNGSVLMETVSPTPITVLVKPNVPTNLTNPTKNAALEIILSITLKSVAVTQKLNGNAMTDSAL